MVTEALDYNLILAEHLLFMQVEAAAAHKVQDTILQVAPEAAATVVLAALDSIVGGNPELLIQVVVVVPADMTLETD